MPFTTIGLSDPLVQGILATGYTAPTEIQSQAIPAAITGRDIIACAQTGTGKTAAFVLPILNRLSHERPAKQRIIRSLILTPTRELAGQIEDAITGYGRFLKLKTLSIYGGVKIGGQFNRLRSGIDIVVATPGRLMDHMNRGTIDLSNVEVLVLDEADRMLDMGFVNDMRKIIAKLPKKRQTMLFSATISKEVKDLAKSIQQTPKIIQIGEERNPIDTITQHIYPVQKDQKMSLLLHMLKSRNMFSVLIFSRTKHGADKISNRLKKSDVTSVAIHSNRTQSQRQLALDGFKSGKFQVMVATDIAARGIDVHGISHVINYDLPAYPEDYLHRIGRTGRAEKTGDAISFVASEERKNLRNIEKYLNCRFKHQKCDDFDYDSYEVVEPSSNDKPRSKPRNKYKSKPKATGEATATSYGQHKRRSTGTNNKKRTDPKADAPGGKKKVRTSAIGKKKRTFKKKRSKSPKHT